MKVGMKYKNNGVMGLTITTIIDNPLVEFDEELDCLLTSRARSIELKNQNRI